MDFGFNTGNKKRRIGVYIRVSTAEQKIDGYGLEAQERRLIEHINNNQALNFFTKPEWLYSDTHTGSDLNREGLNKLRKAVKEKKLDAVLVWKIDRLSRSLKHLLLIFEEFEQNNVSFISVQENIDFKGPIGKLIFQIFGAIAQFERELIKGRTRMGKIASAEMGNYTGSTIPYGYKPVKNLHGKGKKLAIISKEQKWVQQVFDWYIYDNMGFGQVAKNLNELKVSRGEHSRKPNAKWTEKMIRKLVQDPIYRGEYVANRHDDAGDLLPEDKWTITKIPPCVSEYVFQQAQVIRTNRKGGNKNTLYLLSGKLKDMTISPSKSFVGCKRHKGGYSYRRQQFKMKDGTHVSVFEVPAKQIEEFTWTKIMEALKQPEAFIEKHLTTQYANPTEIDRMNSQLESLREKRMNVELAISRIEEAYENGSYDEVKLNHKTAEKNKEIARIDNTIQEVEDKLTFIGSIDIEVQKLKDAASQVKYKLENLTLKQKRVLVDLFVERIEMRRKRSTDPKRRWDIDAQIFFRFNPSKFPNRATKDRTTKPHKKKESVTSDSSSEHSGAARRN